MTKVWWGVVCNSRGYGGILPKNIFVFSTSRNVFRAFSETDFWLYRVSKKTLWKFNRLSCIIDFAKQFNFYIHYNLFISIKIKSVVVRLFFL